MNLDVKDVDKTWWLTTQKATEFSQYFTSATEKGNVKGCCIRCVIPDDESVDHFITYVKGTWYDTGRKGKITKHYEVLPHYECGGHITDLYVIIHKQ